MHIWKKYILWSGGCFVVGWVCVALGVWTGWSLFPMVAGPCLGIAIVSLFFVPGTYKSERQIEQLDYELARQQARCHAYITEATKDIDRRMCELEQRVGDTENIRRLRLLWEEFQREREDYITRY